MLRETSIETYRAIEENGMLSNMRFRVYEYIFKNGPTTMMGASLGLGIEGNTVTPRFAELKSFGVIKEIGHSSDATKHRSILWDVTSSLPVKPVKEESSKKKLSRLEKEIESLRKQLGIQGN